MATINHPLGRPRTWTGLRSPFRRFNGWLVAAIALAAVSAVLPVLQNSSVTSRGFDMQALDAEKARLQGQISVLEADVARYTSLSRIERRAEEIGLVPAEGTIYVTVDEAGPAPAKIPAEFLPGPAPETDGPAPWWRSILGWVPLLD